MTHDQEIRLDKACEELRKAKDHYAAANAMWNDGRAQARHFEEMRNEALKNISDIMLEITGSYFKSTEKHIMV